MNSLMLLAATAMHEQDEQAIHGVRKSSEKNNLNTKSGDVDENLQLLAYITDVVNSNCEVITDDDQSYATNDTSGNVEQQQPLSPVKSCGLIPSTMFRDGMYTPLEKAAACLIQACKLRVEQQQQQPPKFQKQQPKKKQPTKKEAQISILNKNKPKIKKKDMWVLSPSPPSVGGRNRSALRQKLEQQRNKSAEQLKQQRQPPATIQKSKFESKTAAAAAAAEFSTNATRTKRKLVPIQHFVAEPSSRRLNRERPSSFGCNRNDRQNVKPTVVTISDVIVSKTKTAAAAAAISSENIGKISNIDDDRVVLDAAAAAAVSFTHAARTKRKRAPIKHFVAEPSRRVEPKTAAAAISSSNNKPTETAAATSDDVQTNHTPVRKKTAYHQQPQEQQAKTRKKPEVPAVVAAAKTNTETFLGPDAAAVSAAIEISSNISKPSNIDDSIVVVAAAAAASSANVTRTKRKRAPIKHFVAEPSRRRLNRGNQKSLGGNRNDKQNVKLVVNSSDLIASNHLHPVVAATVATATKPLSRTMQKFLERQQQQLEQLELLRKQKTNITGEDEPTARKNSSLPLPKKKIPEDPQLVPTRTTMKTRMNSATKTEILPTKNVSLLQKKKNFMPDQSTETPPSTTTTTTTTNNTVMQKEKNCDPKIQSKTNTRTPTVNNRMVLIKGSLCSILDLSSTITTTIPTSPPLSPNPPQNKKVPVAAAAAMIVSIKQQQQQSSMTANKDNMKKNDEHIVPSTKINYTSVVPVSPSKSSKDTLSRTLPKNKPAVPQKQQSKITGNYLHQEPTTGKDSADDTVATELTIASSRNPSPSRQPPKILASSPCLDIRTGRRQRDEQGKDLPRCVFATDASTTKDKHQQLCPSHLVPSENDSTKTRDADRDNATIVEPSQQEQPECHNGEHRSMTTGSMMTRIPVSRASSPSAELEYDEALPTGAKDEQQRHQQPFRNKHQEQTTTIAKDATAQGADQDVATPPSAQSTTTLFPPSSVLVIPILPAAGCAISQDEGQPHEELSSSTDENAGKIRIDQPKRTHRFDDDAHVAEQSPNKVTNLSLTTKTIVTKATTTAGQHTTPDARTSSTNGTKKRKKRLSSMLAALAPHNKYGNSEDVVFDFTKLGGTESTATMMTKQKRQRRGCPTTSTNTKPTGVTTKDISATNSLRTTRRHRSRRLQ